jgi:hypothetical protein
LHSAIEAAEAKLVEDGDSWRHGRRRAYDDGQELHLIAEMRGNSRELPENPENLFCRAFGVSRGARASPRASSGEPGAATAQNRMNTDEYARPT